MYFSYKNTLVHYQLKGAPDKPAVLFVHGFTESAAMWKSLSKTLKNQFRIVLPDLLGHYKTGLTGNILTMEEQAEMLASLLDYQGIRQAHLIGHSMGGYISLAIAELFPEKVRSITLLNSHPYADPPEKIEARKKGAQAVLRDKYAFLSQTIPGFFAPYNREKLAREIGELIKTAMKMPARGIAGALLGMMSRKDRSELFFQTTDIPRAWIISRDDPLIDVNKFQTDARSAKDLYFKIIDGGHMSYLENPEEMIAAVLNFLKKIKI